MLKKHATAPVADADFSPGNEEELVFVAARVPKSSFPAGKAYGSSAAT
jgi:hypothetical protein